MVPPALGYEVHGFSYVEACGETCVVGTWESQDVFPWHLQRLVYFDLLRKQVGR